MIVQEILHVDSHGRGTQELTGEIRRMVRRCEIQTGLCHLFLHHTSASLILSENADPAVRSDLEAFMARITPDGDPLYRHIDEGPDDMPAHVRTLLAGHDLTIPITRGSLGLGTWQGIYLWEHRHRPHRRTITTTLQGE